MAMDDWQKKVVEDISAGRCAQNVWEHHREVTREDGRFYTEYMSPWDELDEAEREVLTETMRRFLVEFNEQLTTVLMKDFKITPKEA